ncbi:MAG: hypothetical protein OEV28_05485, partial [Nitrospirota bacterium]|nr:hypothetical protein [Nitrospirota bacterium]
MKLYLIATLSAVLMLTGCAGSFSPTIKGSAQEISRARGESLPAGWGTSGMVITVVHDFSSELRETSSYVYRAAAEERRDIRVSLASEESSRNLEPEGLAALSTSSGCRYVLKPAVKSSTEDRSTLVEVSAQLVDTKSGETIW